MGTGYIRQAAANMATGLNIHAADFNAEYNALAAAFNSVSGHAHDGTTGNAPKVDINSATKSNLLMSRGGVPAGGTNLQQLAKNSSADYDVQWVSASSSGWKNALWNGEFQLQQKGAGGALSIAVPSNGLTATFDRWYLLMNAASATYHVGVGGVNGLAANSKFSASVIRDAGQTSTTPPFFLQALPTFMVYPLRGKSVTLSAKLAGGANFSPTSGTVTATILSGTSTEGKRSNTPYTGEVVVATGTVNVGQNTGFIAGQMISITGTMPANAVCAQVQFTWTPVGTAGANDSVAFAEVQLEANAVATAFERISFQEEFQRCQRFYCKSFPYGVAPVTNSGTRVGEVEVIQIVAASTAAIIAQVRFPVQMHYAPSVTIYNSAAANNQVRNLSNNTDCSASNPVDGNENGVSFVSTMAAGSLLGNTIGFHYTAGAEI
jgi:hypothetical protein